MDLESRLSEAEKEAHTGEIISVAFSIWCIYLYFKGPLTTSVLFALLLLLFSRESASLFTYQSVRNSVLEKRNNERRSFIIVDSINSNYETVIFVWSQYLICQQRLVVVSGPLKVRFAYEPSVPSCWHLSHPLDSMLVHRMVTPSIKFASTHSYIYVERGTGHKASRPRTQHDVPSLGSCPVCLIWREEH